MRKALIAIAATALIATGLVAVSTAPASAAGGGNLRITTTDGCPSEAWCITTLSTGIYEDEHDLLLATLTDLRTGAEVPGADYMDKYGDLSLGRQLPASTYLLTVEWSELAHWDCSVYYHDGCIWVKGSSRVYRWKFTYSGAGARIVPPWTPPYTKVKGKVGWNSYVNIRVRGKVGGMRLEQGPNFSLGGLKKTGKRKIWVQVSKGGKWKTIHKGKTKRNGKYNLRFKFEGNRKHKWYWRLYSPPKGSQPAGEKVFSKAFRVA